MSSVSDRGERPHALRGVAAQLSAVASRDTSKYKPKDEEWAGEFLGSLMEGHTILEAVAVAGVDMSMPYKRRKYDEEFRRAWKEAIEISTDLMEAEAARRAFHGTLKPVFHKGMECGRIREYSDTLMIFLLKARRPEVYRDKFEDGGVRGGGTTINVNVEVVRDRRDLGGNTAPVIDVEVVNNDDSGRFDSDKAEVVEPVRDGGAGQLADKDSRDTGTAGHDVSVRYPDEG